MSVLVARDLIQNVDHIDIWKMGDRHHVTHIDIDGKMVETSIRKVIVSRGAWLFNEMYPDMPLKESYLQKSVFFSPSALNKLLETAYFDCMEFHGFDNKDLTDDELDLIDDWKLKSMFRINDFYNSTAIHTARFVRGQCAADYLDLLKHPPIAAIRHEIQTSRRISPARVSKLMDQAEWFLLNDDALLYNPIAVACRCGSMKAKQVVQIFFSRGFGADVDGRVFRTPYRYGFFDGVRTLAANMIVSRDASTAKYYQGPPTQQSEYLNRRLRLLALVFRSIDLVDCQSTDYEDQIIPDQKMLKAMLGKYYLTEHGLKPIRQGDNHLIGKPIKVRMLSSCKSSDRYSFCWRCAGELAHNLPRDASLGYTSAATAVQEKTQTLLSRKHVILSAILSILATLCDTALRYVRVGEDVLEGKMYLIEPERNVKLKLVLSAEEAKFICDLENVKNIDAIALDRISKISMLLFIKQVGNQEPVEELARIGYSDSNAFLSASMLKYIVKRGFEIDVKGNYTVDLDEWMFDEPFIKFPPSLISMPVFIAYCARFMTNKSVLTDDDTDDGDPTPASMLLDEKLRVEKYLSKGARSLDEYRDHVARYPSASAGIMAFHQLVSQQLDINILHLEVLVHALTVESAAERDFRPPLDRKNADLLNYNDIMWYRNPAAALAYEQQAHSTYSVEQMLVKRHASHPMDELYVGVDDGL